MIEQPLIWFGISLIVFLATWLLLLKERRMHRRLFASSVRTWLDQIIERLAKRIATSFEHFVKYVVQLHWYYSIHSILKALLRTIVATYNYFELVFERNRNRTKELRAEKRQLHELHHLRQMAEHKKEVALTAAQKRKLRHKKLEERH